MAIQWYPGHMTAARKKAAETMAQTDMVIEVVDARLPAASSNPMIAELRLARQRPSLAPILQCAKRYQGSCIIVQKACRCR
jgi:ribosome biogenesis GTPase A